jgi:hypothetical protein
LSAGRVSIDRVVVDAAMAARQRDLISAFRERRSELILDTNVAELSSKLKYSGSLRGAPWALADRPLSLRDLSSETTVVHQIAEFAVKAGFDAILAPTHFLQDADDPALRVDVECAIALRKALDGCGGEHIGIDYPLLVSYAALRDARQANDFLAALEGIPFDNLWLRISGFGADASPAGVQRFISAVMRYHSLGRPIVADGVGGVAGLAALAFGAVGGICHGVAEKERFDAAEWESEAGSRRAGSERRILIEGLDRLLTTKQAAVLMASVSGRRHFSCGNAACCPRGFDDTLRDPKAHYLFQRQQQVRELSAVPPGRRVIHFLDKQVAPLRSKALHGKHLELSDPKVVEVIRKSGARLEKMHAVLRALRGSVSGRDCSATPVRRLGLRGNKTRRRR